MNKPKFVSIPTKFEKQEFEDKRFLKVKIYVMHDKLNFNGSYFGMSAIEKAKESIFNIPILAFVKNTNGDDYKDFKGHEDEVVIDNEGNANYRYLGVPIGVIPADKCNYRYETFDDKTYVVVDGYIWTDYANEALEIFIRDIEKSQSMEIMVNDAKFDEENCWYEILDYKYTGLCALGDDVTPAMEGAKIKISSDMFSKFSTEYQEKIKELSEILKKFSDNKNEKEGSKMDENTEIQEEETMINEENETDSEKEVITESTNDENDKESNEDEDDSIDENEEKYESRVEEIQENEQGEDKGIELADGILETALKENEKLKKEIKSLYEFKEKVLKEKEDADKEQIFQEYELVISNETLESLKNERDKYTSEQLKVKLNEMVAKDVMEKAKENGKRFSTETTEQVRMDTVKKASPKSKYAV